MTLRDEPANTPLRTNLVQDSSELYHASVEIPDTSLPCTSLAAKLALAAIILLHITISIIGINWGLPSRSIDKYLFGEEQPWSGEKIYRLAKAADKFSNNRGADVDADPVHSRIEGQLDDSALPIDYKTPGKVTAPIPLTATEEDVARIYLRYRLYTYQPDEMITMMALAGMKPSQWNFDPRLYQYGGLFIYPVGAFIKLCGMLGLIDVRSDVVYYLDHPDEFGKFYIVARAYSAAWGAIGVVVVFAITRLLSSSSAGIMAALLFVLMPVVVCMSHEGKPHLPGAVLMLIAVWFAMKYVEYKRPIFFLCLSITCGAAVGMVLSSWPICILIPIVAWMNRYRSAIFSTSSNVPMTDASNAVSNFKTTPNRWLAIAVKGTLIAITCYLVTNPYIVINGLTNREVLRSNFGNSFAMYQVSRIGEGFIRVLELTAEGATWPILILGTIAFMLVIWQLVRNDRHRPTILQTEPSAQAKEVSEPGEQATGHSHSQTEFTNASPLVNDFKRALPLLVVATLFFFQFVLIGAGKPAEYGRFGIFTNTALTIGAATLLGGLAKKEQFRLLSIVLLIPFFLFVTTANGSWYLLSFTRDVVCGSRCQFPEEATRNTELKLISHDLVYVGAEPAPYSCPPLDFSTLDVRLARSISTLADPRIHRYRPTAIFKAIDDPEQNTLSGPFAQDSTVTTFDNQNQVQVIGRVDGYQPAYPFPTQISWANKPILWIYFNWQPSDSEN